VEVPVRPILDMDNIQIEITNFCMNSCSNCTRLCGHHEKPYFMDLDMVKKAIDSMECYPKMTGIMGGEPLLHPKFEAICDYLASKIPKEQCGLWTCLPKGKEHLREVIVKTFGHIFINDHTREDIVHAPILVASEELPLKGFQKDYLISKCWVQESWSASINEKGAWFCEVAAALATLLDVNDLAFAVEKLWWGRSPQHYVDQMKMCHLCGCAMPLKKRISVEEVDDISPKMFERLKDISPKIKKMKYEIHNLELYQDDQPIATYKDEKYRDAIAKRYGMFLMVNDHGFQTPYLLKNFERTP
jgi:hypothetical protein